MVGRWPRAQPAGQRLPTICRRRRRLSRAAQPLVSTLDCCRRGGTSRAAARRSPGQTPKARGAGAEKARRKPRQRPRGRSAEPAAGRRSRPGATGGPARRAAAQERSGSPQRRGGRPERSGGRTEQPKGDRSEPADRAGARAAARPQPGGAARRAGDRSAAEARARPGADRPRQRPRDEGRGPAQRGAAARVANAGPAQRRSASGGRARGRKRARSGADGAEHTAFARSISDGHPARVTPAQRGPGPAAGPWSIGLLRGCCEVCYGIEYALGKVCDDFDILHDFFIGHFSVSLFPTLRPMFGACSQSAYIY